MSQVSRMPLHIEVEKRVFEVLLETVATAQTTTDVDKFLSDLLSPTERIMIAKRISIALLLMKNYDQRTIAKWLKVSLGTVSKVSYFLHHGTGGYKKVVSSVLAKEELQVMLEKIDDAIANLFPPVGRNWSQWRRERWLAKMANKKAF